jgi:hypothetical protein
MPAKVAACELLTTSFISFAQERRQLVPSSPPTLRRSTPIVTTALALVIRVEPEGTVNVRLVA